MDFGKFIFLKLSAPGIWFLILYPFFSWNNLFKNHIKKPIIKTPAAINGSYFFISPTNCFTVAPKKYPTDVQILAQMKQLINWYEKYLEVSIRESPRTAALSSLKPYSHWLINKAAIPYLAIRFSSFVISTFINLRINFIKVSRLYNAIRKNAPWLTYEAAVDTATIPNTFRYPLKARNPAAINTLSPSKKVRIKIAI